MKMKKEEKCHGKCWRGLEGSCGWGSWELANECEENMVIFHKNRQMRTQPEGEKKNHRKTGKAANKIKKFILYIYFFIFFFCCPARLFFSCCCSWNVIQRHYRVL